MVRSLIVSICGKSSITEYTDINLKVLMVASLLLQGMNTLSREATVNLVLSPFLKGGPL